MKAIGSLLISFAMSLIWLLTTTQPKVSFAANAEQRVRDSARAALDISIQTPTETSSNVKTNTPTPSPTNTSYAYLTHGPVVGAVTDNSALVFVRTNDCAEVRVRYGTTADLHDGVLGALYATTLEHDFTMQNSLTGLVPSTTYYVDILVNSVPQLNQPYPHFKTFPNPGEPTSFKFVVLEDFGKFAGQPVPTFMNVDAEQPDFVIIGGDFDHRNPDVPGNDEATRQAKRQMFQDQYTPDEVMGDFINLILRHYPVAHFWDDHDYGKDNSDKTYPHKRISLEVLQEYFPVYPVSRYGDWQKFKYGQAEFFLLDSRSQRDSDSTPNGPSKSMLDGDNLGKFGQLIWLQKALRKSTATWKFIFSPVTFNPTVHKKDSWYAFGYERNSILNFIKNHNISGVIVISGDWHSGGLDDGTNAGLPEMAVPPANQLAPICNSGGGTGIWSNGYWTYPGPNNKRACNGYGVISVRTNPDRVLFQVKSAKGKRRLELTLGK